MSTADIDIDRLLLALRLNGERERLEPVARRLRELAGQRLHTALARVDLGLNDDGYVFIERLSVDCGANTAWSDDAIADHIARRLALSLHARLAQDDVLRFRDRAEYVAAYLVARADGRAERCWWFDEFEGLQRLGTSIALRTLVLNEGDTGVAALARLSAGALVQVLGCISEGDAARLLAAWSQRTAAVDAPLPNLWHATQRLDAQGAAIHWVRTLIELERITPGALGAPCLAALRALARLHSLARDGQLLPLAGRPWRAWLQACTANWELDARWLEAAADSELALVAEALSQQAMQGEGGAVEARWLSTRFGGCFVLLARLHRLGWITRWQRCAEPLLPSDPPAEAERFARQLALCVCAVALGGERAIAVLHDATLQSACAVDAVSAPLATRQRLARHALRATLHEARCEPLREWHELPFGTRLQGLLAQTAHALLRDFAHAVPGLAEASPNYLRRNALDLPAVFETAEARVHLGRAPLDVLLVLCGAKRGTIDLPGARRLTLREDAGA